MKKRYIFGDLLRSLAIFMVIIIHCTANYYVNNGAPTLILIVSSLTCSAVPLFYMVSGCFSIRKEVDFDKKYINKIIKRVLQLLFWTLIYLLIFKFILHQDIAVFNQMLKALFTSQIGHLWFMYPLLGLYVLNPIISKLYYSLNKNQMKIFLIITFIIPTVLNTISRIKPGIISIPQFALGWPEVGLFILGKYIFDNKDKISNKKVFLFITAIVGYILVIGYAKIDILKYGISGYKPYFDYGQIPCALLTISLFSLAISFNDNIERFPKFIKKLIISIGGCSAGIYYMHMIPIYILGSITIFDITIIAVNEGRFIFMMFGALFYFIITYSFAFLLKRLPYLNSIIE